MDQSKTIVMKLIEPPLPSRTESHKIKGKDSIKSSAKAVQFVDDFPSTSSMMKLKVLSPSATWMPKMSVSMVFIPCSQLTFTSEKIYMKNIGELSEAMPYFEINDEK